MPMPSFSDLDKEQRQVYSESPMCGSLLVTGPPGTGKTVVAFHRGLSLMKMDSQPATLVMFGKVLRHYVQTLESNHSIKITHFDQWFPNWFRSAFGSAPPKVSGGRFAKDTDWDRAIAYLDRVNDGNLDSVHWGHLIIDEGQDLPVGFYKFAKKVIERTSVVSEKCPTLSVYADDNQTITDKNSTIREIKNELKTRRRDKRFWRLFRNYRNSYPIAKFSQHFQLLKLGAAELPINESGRKPDVIFHKSWEMIAKQIVNLAWSNPGSTGVVFFGRNNDMAAFHKVISRECRELARPTPVIYKYGEDEKNLNFTKDGPISIVNVQSCKGLEFDNVIALNWDATWGSMLSEEVIKQMYVVSSRARSSLLFMSVSNNEDLPNQIGLLPHPDNELATFRDLTDWKDQMENRLKRIDWSSSERDFDRQRALAISKEIINDIEQTTCLLGDYLKNERFPVNEADRLKQAAQNKDVDQLVSMIINIGPKIVDNLINQTGD